MLVPAVLLACLAAACGDGGPAREDSPGAIVDWVDFIRFDDVRYLRMHPAESAKLSVEDLGPEYARVLFTLNGNVNEPNYRSKHGDAAYLAGGTPLYEVKGYDPRFLLAVRFSSEVTLYEADSFDAPTTGAGALDIAGRVQSVGIYSQQGDGTRRLGQIDDSETVDLLISAILAAPYDPVDPRDHAGGVRLEFEMTDGLVFSRIYFRENGELTRGYRLPAEARSIIEAALGQALRANTYRHGCGPNL